MKSAISFFRFENFKFFALSFFVCLQFFTLTLGSIVANAEEPDMDALVDEYVQPSNSPVVGTAKETQQVTQTAGIITELSAAQTSISTDPLIEMTPECAKLKASIQYCKLSAITAKGACIGVSSPWILKGISILSGLGAVVGVSKSATDVCKKVDSKMKDVQNAMTAYNAACGGAMAACSKTCPNLASDISICTSALQAGVRASAAAGYAAGGYTKSLNALAALSKTVSSQVKVCSVYKWNLASAVAGLATAVAAKRSASGCQDATTTENNQNIVDCSDPKNKSNTTCICMRNPGTAGCGNANLFAGTPTVGTSSGSGSGSNLTIPTGDGLTGGGDGGTNPLAGLGHSSGGGGGSSIAPGSGGGGGGGLGGGSGSGADGKDKTGGTKGLNTNILSGTDSGGGGGGSRGSSGGSSYQAYLPGGEKDPNRNVASQTPASALAAQVSAAGSKSNWEKVNDRYREAKSSLVPGQ